MQKQHSDPLPLPATVAATVLPKLFRAVLFHPEKCDVTSEENDSTIAFTVAPCHSDTPMLIGKKGATLKAFQLIAIVIGHRHGKEIEVGLKPDGESKLSNNGDDQIEEDNFYPAFKNLAEIATHEITKGCSNIKIHDSISSNDIADAFVCADVFCKSNQDTYHIPDWNADSDATKVSCQ